MRTIFKFFQYEITFDGFSKGEFIQIVSNQIFPTINFAGVYMHYDSPWVKAYIIFDVLSRFHISILP